MESIRSGHDDMKTWLAGSAGLVLAGSGSLGIIRSLTTELTSEQVLGIF